MDGTELDRPAEKLRAIKNFSGADIAAMVWDRIEQKRR